jgi:LPS O-antigen subunit length determinant protein (WzzB/FepE family)
MKMDHTALIRRRQRLQQQRDAELRTCRAKWRSRINTVDRLLRIAAARGIADSQPSTGQDRPIAVYADALAGDMKGDRKESVLKLLRHILQHNRGFFTVPMLVDLINKTRRLSVTCRELSQTLGNLRQLGEIRLVDPGQGRKPHVYLKL